jgi:AraC-like DNA-binding protein
MAGRFRVPGTLVRRIEELGLARAAVLRQARLPPTLFDQERILLDTEELFALYRAIEALSEDPSFGLKLGSEERVERYDPIAIAALYTRSAREALHRLARYKELTCPERIDVTEDGTEYRVQFVWLAARETEPALLVDLCFACVVAIMRRGTGRTIAPRRIELLRPPAHRSVYEAHFGCPVTFSAPRNAIVFDVRDVDQPFVTHNPDLLGMVAPQLEAELAAQTASRALGEQVKAILKRLLAGQRPGLQDVARELRLSTRTLQRRLAAETATFQQLLEQARRELARHYLLHSSLELNETAYLLGYEDVNSFFRAFHDWEGHPPGEWRTLQRQSEQARPAGSA